MVPRTLMVTIKKRPWKVLILCVLLAAGVTGCQPPAVRALLRGKRLIERGDYSDAVDSLKKSVSLASTNAQAWNYLGLAYHYDGKPAEAAQSYQRAFALDHDLVEAHFNLGCLWLEQGRLDAARAELTSFTLRRSTPEGWIRLGLAQLRSAQARNLKPDARAADLASAEKSFNEALRLSPQNPEALNGLGLLQVQRNRVWDAAQDFFNALKQEPHYAPAILNLAILSHTALNNRTVAVQKYHEYLSLSPHQPNWEAVNAVVTGLEQQMRASGETAAPVSNTVRTSTVPAPRPATNPVPRTSAATNPGKPPIAGTTNAAPPVPEKHSLLSHVNPLNLFHGSSTTAPSAGKPVTSGTPAPVVSANYPRYHYHSFPKPEPGSAADAEEAFKLGVQAQQTGHLSEAMEAYHRATELDPADFRSYYNLGLAAATAGDNDESLIAYESALAIRPESPDARYNFAWMLKQGNYMIDAANELERLVASYPNEARAHLALGNLYAQQLHQPARAREHYLRVLETDPQNAQTPAIRDWLISHKK
jgi:Flp pilus assembly protein TadD